MERPSPVQTAPKPLAKARKRAHSEQEMPALAAKQPHLTTPSTPGPSSPRSPKSPRKEGQPKAKRQRKAKEAFSPAQQPQARSGTGQRKGKRPKGATGQEHGAIGAEAKPQEAAMPSREPSPFPQLLRRVKAQLSRMRQEQALLDVYAAEGWRGSKKEAVRPHSELARAAAQVAKCRASIRECVRLCEESQGERPIPPELFDEDGELDEEFIFCCRCTQVEAPEENDIVLCDGPCNRAYHFWCVRPPLQESDLNEEDGWLCPACDTKADIVHELNDALGTDLDLETGWDGFLPEDAPQPALEAVRANGGSEAATLLGGDLPSEDESDFSFREGSCSGSGSNSKTSSAAGAQHLPSYADGQTSDQNGGPAEHEGSLQASFAGSDEDEDSSEASGDNSSSAGSGIDESASDATHNSEVELVPRTRRQAARAGSSEAPTSRQTPVKSHQGTPEGDEEPLGPRRGRRRPVDYVKLAAAMFGGQDGDREPEEDQDYSPGKDRQRASLGSAGDALSSSPRAGAST